MVVSNIQYSYLKSGKWNTFTNRTQNTMDGIKLQTAGNSSYYLQYRTWNEGKSDFYSFVKSNENDFAGVSGRPIQRLQIQAYRKDGTKLTSGVVVMYRVSNGGRWLPWVSNAEAPWMQSVQTKYNLGGTVDADSYYAGNPGVNIDGVEILVYEEGSVGDFTGGEVAATLSSMSGNLNNWEPFEKVKAGAPMDGIKIQTSSSKDYYLEYRTKNAGNAEYYSWVKSTGTAYNDYAGYPGKSIQLLSIKAFRSDGTQLRSGVIVMYRVCVNDRWLPWVSNADPQWMQSAKSKYGLDGILDTESTYAGNEGESINGVEIRIFEDDSSNPGLDSFTGSEIKLTTKYMSGNLNNWQDFSKKLSSANIDGLKIATSSSESFYLTYQSQNAGNGEYYPMVKSTGTAYNDYAGYPGKPMQLLRIKAFSNDGVQLRTGVVVMYRVSIKGRWLPWVSNANPEWMRSVQQQYNLDGSLDTESDYAGNQGETIDGVEIRAFRGETNDHPVGDLPGMEYAPTMEYMVGSLSHWEKFTRSVMNTSIDGLKIPTGGDKPYYLSYKSWNAGNRDYYPAVRSTDKAYNSYAGYPGKPIRLLHIDVYRNDGVQLRKGVVVMYRVHVDNRWLPWVSSAEPEWMRKVHAQYNLDGTLDTESYYAGNMGQNINGVEIRIFEENNIDITPTGKSKIIKIPNIDQKREGYPTGCESVTAVMALRYAKLPIEIAKFVAFLPKKLSGPPFDPDVEFGGHPTSQNGYGCYAPVIKETCDACLFDNLNKHAEVLRGKSIANLCSEYIDNNVPVIFWATDSMKPSYKHAPWTANGKTIQWISPMHCLLLVGYDDNHYIFNDPLKEANVTYYRKDVVNTAYKALGQQAVVIKENPSNEMIAEKKKEKFREILKDLHVPSNKLDKADFGLFRSASYDVKVTEHLPGMDITYSCGYAANLGYSGSICKINVDKGQLVVSSEALDKVSTTFTSHGFSSPIAALNSVAVNIGYGRILVGVKVKERTISLYLTISLDVEITNFYSEELNVSVEFEMKNNDPELVPELRPDFEFSFVPSNEEQWEYVAMVCLSVTVAYFEVYVYMLLFALIFA